MNPNIESVAVDEFAPPVELEADRFLVFKDVLRYVGLGKTTVYRLIKENKFPQRIRIDSCSTVLFSLRDIQQWQEEQRKGGVE